MFPHAATDGIRHVYKTAHVCVCVCVRVCVGEDIYYHCV